MKGGWKRRPVACAELATDAVTLGPTSTAAKHCTSKSTARRLASETRNIPTTPEELAE